MVTGKLPEATFLPAPTLADLIGKVDEILARLPPLDPERGQIAAEGIEVRFKRLEAARAQLERDIGQIRKEQGDLRDRLVRVQQDAIHMPSKGLAFFVLGALVAGAAAVTFQGEIQALANTIFV